MVRASGPAAPVPIRVRVSFRVRVPREPPCEARSDSRRGALSSGAPFCRFLGRSRASSSDCTKRGYVTVICIITEAI